MQVLAPSTINPTYRTHVFETPLELSINGQIYDKKTMKPVSGAFFNENYGGNNKCVLFKSIDLFNAKKGYIYKEPEYKWFVRDIADKDVFYCWHNSTCAQGYISKVRKTEKSYDMISTISPNSGYVFNNGHAYSYYGDPYNYKYLGQTNEYLVFIQNYFGYPYTGDVMPLCSVSIIRIKKTDMSCVYSTIGAWSDFCATVLQSDENYIFLHICANGDSIIIRYNIMTNTFETLYSSQASGKVNANAVGLSNIIKFNDNFYTITNGSNKYILEKFTINFDTGKIIMKPCVITYSSLTYMRLGNTGNYSYKGWPCFTLHNIDDKYIQITCHDNANDIHAWYSDDYSKNVYRPKNIFSNLKLHRNIVIQEESDDNFKEICAMPLDTDTQLIYGVLYYDDYKMFVFFSDKIKGYEFNPETKEYRLFYEKTGAFAQIGFDEYDRLYLNDNYGKVYQYDISYPSSIDISMEHDSYGYIDKDIFTFCKLSAKNFLGEYLACSIKCTLIGNAYFEENENNEIIIDTQKSESNVPVIITGPGTISVYAEAMEG